MVGEAMGMIQDIDAALLVVDVDVAMQVGGGKGGVGDPEGTILRQLTEAGRPVVLAVNKVDTLKAKSLLLPVLERLGTNEMLRAIVPISASKGRTSTIWSASCGRCCPRGRRSTRPRC
jgi:GTP-binding protein Era